MIMDQYEYLMNNILGARIVFDVGAKDGRDTFQFLRIFPHANIWAFDCSPLCIDRLEESFRHEPRVTVIPRAVSDQRGQETFYSCSMRGSSGLFPVSREFSIEAKNTGSCEVESITLDDFIEEQDIDHVDLLKIDIEGADLLALRGCQRTISRGKIRAVLCELLFYPYYVDQCSYTEICNYLSYYGFSLHAMWPQYWGGRLRYANALFL
jgi:FkbM family methyltransferase